MEHGVGIGATRPPRGQDAGRHSAANHDEQRGKQGERIKRAHAEQDAREHSRDAEAEEEPDRGADDDWPHPLLQHERHDVATARAERDADADLAHAPPNGVRHDAVDADEHEHERDAAERRRERADDAREAAPAVEIRLERRDLNDELGIERGNLGANRRSGRRVVAAALDEQRPTTAEAGDAYAYPSSSPDLTEPGFNTGTATYKLPVTPGGFAAYTSAPLDEDLVVAGPGSADLWLASTATDTDLQITVTEIRPDGNETYIQRGWLRASHRKLDTARSTPLRPYQTHLRADAQPLKRLQPTYMRVEIFPFAHAFRKGSRVRVYIDAPTSHTGFWAFAPYPEPAINTVLHDAAHPSRIVLGELRGQKARGPLPACDTLRNQPCRPSS